MERDSSSDDDDDDDEALVLQNEAKPPSPHNLRHHRASFEISGNLTTRISSALRHLFRGVSFTSANAPEDRMREAELRALYLLRDQQLGLANLWNSTFSRSNVSLPAISSHTISNVTSGPSKDDLPQNSLPISLEEFRSALIKQIKLNKLIQNALLSVHRDGNASVEAVDDNADADIFGTEVNVCRKVKSPVDRRTVEWVPKKDRFLFAICVSGQMSNHLICLEKHMLIAALLGRVLVFPSHKLDYNYSQVLDINHINECLDREVVISYDNFVGNMKNKLKIDKFLCYIASPPCYLDEEHIKRLKNMGISMGKIEAAWPEDANSKVQKKRFVADVVSKFSSEEEVIAIGDMFYADIEEEWVMQPGGPISHKCKVLIQPSRQILITAQRFVQTFLGSNFVALHFRRHGFLKFCNVKNESCFYPIPQAAECILRVMERTKSPLVYLSTDAAESETDLLKSLVVLDGKPIPLVKRPTHSTAEKWDALLYRNHLDGEPQVEAMLDKSISAMSAVFVGAPGSTFTEDILRLRRGWGTASRCDEYLCQGELPSYIAEAE
ncbi:hypothetical protein HPP92_012158 [Vanilla planifolia]|uniref:GDP-fucose protein O-fucosyltransferase 2 n=1 Tax=Vanilla planifolia TaxID=51239 RepID=A0A835V1P7_VANPL|nr:hypothetical protein HPP92_012158 [Vanilla planifolia]